jgi:hypothetical protein
MSISESAREFVRQRAQFACEYCGIREVDVGGQLTIDHFRPRASEGDDSLENLVYCSVLELANVPEHSVYPPR